MACSLRLSVQKSGYMEPNVFGEYGAMGTRRSQAGMTFIELMSVVAIIGIITTIALPNIKNYSARAKVSEAILALTSCRGNVQEIYLSGGNTLPAEGDWGCERGTMFGTPAVSKFVDSVWVDTAAGGVIKVQLSPGVGDARIANQNLTMAPIHRAGHPMSEDDLGQGVYRWRCGLASDGTEIELMFLPSSCRGF
jgi:type IV pilus assembly protein PilA